LQFYEKITAKEIGSIFYPFGSRLLRAKKKYRTIELMSIGNISIRLFNLLDIEKTKVIKESVYLNA
jgi:hypothetical protein